MTVRTVNELPEFGDRVDDLPLPSGMPPQSSEPCTWVVKQGSGGELRVLADSHSTYARPDGTELRFFVDSERVATVRAGSWHWCVRAAQLEEGQS